MARKYGHVQDHEKEIKEMLEQGMSQCEIGKALGFSKEQMRGFVKRLHAYNNQRLQSKTKLTPFEKRNQFVA